MAHEIIQSGILDIVGLRHEQAWHGLGKVITDDLTAVEAAERFGLTWPVEQWSLTAHGPNGQTLDVSSHVANIRTESLQGASIKELLGIVGADYQVCQNRELAEFTDALAQTGKVVIETCGSIRGGKRVWFLARGEAFDVGGKDEVFPYVLVSNGHDHQQAIRVTPTTIRVVCSNTLHMVLPREGGAETAAIAIRHSGRIQDKLTEAKNALKHYSSILKQNQELFNRMQSTKFDKDQAMQLFANAYSSYWTAPTGEELSDKDARVRTLAERRQERMKEASAAFMERYNREKKELKLTDSMWLAFNAMSGFLQHDKAECRGVNFQDKVAKRIDRNLFGVNATRTQEVLAQALALAT